jgi:hypothetical protein
VQNPWQTPRASISESVPLQSCFTPLHVFCNMISFIKQFSHDEFLKILTIRTPRHFVRHLKRRACFISYQHKQQRVQAHRLFVGVVVLDGFQTLNGW